MTEGIHEVIGEEVSSRVQLGSNFSTSLYSFLNISFFSPQEQFSNVLILYFIPTIKV